MFHFKRGKQQELSEKEALRPTSKPTRNSKVLIDVCILEKGSWKALQVEQGRGECSNSPGA